MVVMYMAAGAAQAPCKELPQTHSAIVNTDFYQYNNCFLLLIFSSSA